MTLTFCSKNISHRFVHVMPFGTARAQWFLQYDWEIKWMWCRFRVTSDFYEGLQKPDDLWQHTQSQRFYGLRVLVATSSSCLDPLLSLNFTKQQLRLHEALCIFNEWLDLCVGCVFHDVFHGVCVKWSAVWNEMCTARIRTNRILAVQFKGIITAVSVYSHFQYLIK